MPADNRAVMVNLGGVIVMLATLFVIGFLSVLVYAPWTFRPRHMGGLLGPVLIGSMIISGMGRSWDARVDKGAVVGPRTICGHLVNWSARHSWHGDRLGHAIK
jgi:hypothetical protein